MSNHSKTILSLEAWAYHSPDLLKNSNIAVDIGNLTEALIYYDSVLIVPGTEKHFALFIQWFIERGKLDDFLSLVKEGSIEILNYAFFTAPMFDERTGAWSIWNFDDAIYQSGNSFFEKILYHEAIGKLLPKSRVREKLYKSFENRVIDMSPASFKPALDNAREDFMSAEKSAFAVQAFIDDLYSINRLGKPPKIMATAKNIDSKTTVNFNIGFEEVNKMAGKNIDFSGSTVISALAQSNRAIWTAAKLDCDLFQGSPMASLTRNKFSEVNERNEKKSEIIDELQKEVEFPDIRKLINSGEISWELVMEFRRKGKKFREWLNSETERDRNAIIAYHHEVAKEMKLQKYARKTLSFFGVTGSIALSTVAGASLAGPLGATAGAIAGGLSGEALKYFIEVTAKLGSGWKPVVFGNWIMDRIREEK